MNLLLALKASPDLGMLTPFDWQADQQQQINTRYTRYLLRGYDESAAEMALMLRDNMAVNLTALTIADEMAEPALKQLLALDYQQVVRIAPPPAWDLRFNPATIAALIAAYHQQVAPQTAIVMGAQSLEGQNSQTPFILAECLNWPCVTGVCLMTPAVEADTLQVTRNTGYGLEILTLRLPVVLVVGNSPQASVLRVPTLKQKLAASQRQIQPLSPAELGVMAPVAPEVQLQSLTYLQHRRAGVVIDGDSVEQKVQQLYQEHLKGRW